MRWLAIKDYPTIDSVKESYPSAYVIQRVWYGWVVFFDRGQWVTWKDKI